MSVTSISSVADPYQTTNAKSNSFQKVRSDFQQLQDALSSGDVSKSQQALTTLQGDLPSGASSGPIAKALGAIGDSLKSGDVSGAQQALAGLQQQGGAKGVHHHHHHPQGVSASSVTSTSSTAASPLSGIGSLINTSA